MSGAATMRVALITEGDPDRMSGGFLYHRRIVALAADHDAEVRFVSVPDRRFPLAVVDGPAVMRSAVRDADVVVVDSLASNTLGPWLALGLGRKRPIVGSVHQDLGGIDGGPLRRRVQRRFDRMAWAASARLVVASDLLAAQLAADGVRRETMIVIPPGRDLLTGTRSMAVPELRRGRATAVLCVGNWLARKGIVETIDAVAALPHDLATLHLVGDETVDPAYRARVVERVREADVADRVVRHGVVDPESMSACYDAADIFVLASTVEPYGTVYGEAMTAGVPVVGWAAGNLPNLVDDRVEGRLVPTGDVAALSAALQELAGDGARRAQMGAAARVRARALPTWDEAAARFFATCRASCDRPADGPM